MGGHLIEGRMRSQHGKMMPWVQALQFVVSYAGSASRNFVMVQSRLSRRVRLEALICASFSILHRRPVTWLRWQCLQERPYLQPS